MAKEITSASDQLAELLAGGNHPHIYIRHIAEEDEGTGDESQTEWREGWVCKYDQKKEQGKEPYPGIQVLCTDGYLRDYWCNTSDLSEAAQEVTREEAGTDHRGTQYYWGGGDAFSEAQFQEKLAKANYMGGDAVGRALLSAGELVSRRVSVWYPDVSKWYAGIVYKWDKTKSSAWHVGFDDGDDEVYDMRKTQWKLERTQVLLEDKALALTVDHDTDSGKPESLQAFINTKVSPNKLTMEVGQHCVLVHADTDGKRRKQKFVFLYPKPLDAESATAVVDKEGQLKITVPIPAQQ